MSQIDFLILFSILFGEFYCISKIPQKELTDNYWKYLFPIALSFVLIIGLRYGWGNDYMAYKWRIEHPSLDEDLFFGSINAFLAGIGMNYVCVFLLYALCMVWGGFLYLKSFKDNKYMLVLFLPAMFYSATFMIRQGFALAFVFFGFYYLASRKYIQSALFLIFAIKIHTGILTLVLCPLIFMLIKKWYDKPFPYRIIIPLYLMVSLLQNSASQFFAQHMSNAFAFLDYFGKFSSYSENNDQWFGEDGISDIYQQSELTMFLSIAFETAIIYLGSIALKYRKDRRIICFYNTVIVGLFIMRIGYLLEIIHRIGQSIMSFYFIPLGFSLFVLLPMLKRRQLKSMEAIFVRIFVSFGVLYLVLYYGRVIFMSPTYEFVWS